MRDANQLARDYSHRVEEEAPPAQPLSPQGTFTVWQGLREMLRGDNELYQESACRMQIKDSGAIILYDIEMNATILYPWPGAYINFLLDREGE